MKTAFLEYQTFPSEAALKDFVIRLDKNNIPYQVAKYASGLDSTYLGAGAVEEYALKLEKDRFEEVNRLLEKEAEKDFHLLDSGYFLFDFTDEELNEIIANPREWFRKDVVYAGKIMEERGIPISISELREKVEQKYRETYKAVKADPILLILGYLFAPLSMFIGSLLGSLSIFIGLYISFWRRTDEHGRKLWVFDAPSRRQGKVILAIGTIVFASFWILFLTDQLPYFWWF